MAYNEIRTINNIQLEDIKAREEIETIKKNISSLQTKEDFDNTVGNWSLSHPNETITKVVDGIKIPDVSNFVTNSDFNTKQKEQDKIIDTKADKEVVETLQSTKADKSDLVNGLHYVGTTTYSALPTSGNNVGDFYYVTDGDGTNGEGNYAWNGTSWNFSGKTTNISTNIIDDTLSVSGKAADAKETGDKVRELKEDLQDYNQSYYINEFNPTLNTTTQDGVTLTKNIDGTYALSGTASKDSVFSLGLYDFDNNKSDIMVLSGCPYTNGNTRLYFTDNYYDIGDGVVIGVGYVITLPLYFWVSKNTNLDGLILRPMLEKGLFIHPYTPYDKPINILPITDNIMTAEKTYNKYKTVINKKIDFHGQTAIFFGDSITEGITSIEGKITVTQNNYVKAFSDSVNFSQYTNKGLRGQAYSIGTKFETYIRETNLNPYNYLFIAGGINDWANGVPLHTFKDCVNSCFDYIKTISHLTDVFVISPINYASTAYSGGDSHVADVHGYRQALFESAISHGFNFINTDNFSLDSSIGKSEFLGEPIWYKQFSDGLHPTEIGYYIFGKELANTLIHCPVLGDVHLQAKSNFTGKYWYDTNAIYEYVLVDSMSAESVPLPVTDFDVNGIAPLSITGFIKRKSDNIEFPVGYYEPDGTFIRYRMLNNSFYLYVSKDLVGGTVNLVFKYTKGR